MYPGRAPLPRVLLEERPADLARALRLADGGEGPHAALVSPGPGVAHRRFTVAARRLVERAKSDLTARGAALVVLAAAPLHHLHVGTGGHAATTGTLGYLLLPEYTGVYSSPCSRRNQWSRRGSTPSARAASRTSECARSPS